MAIPHILLVKAIKVAVEFHGTQTDKIGCLYIEHPLAVMNRVSYSDNDVKAVAVLHDILEDTSCSAEDLSFLPKNLVDTILLLTKYSSEETYAKYISRIIKSGNEIAQQVKLADIAHNLSRLHRIKDEKTKKRLKKKYEPAIKRIIEVIDERISKLPQ